MLRRPQMDEADVLAALWHDGWRDAHLAIVPDALAQHRTPDIFAARLRAKWDEIFVAGPVGAPEGFAVLDHDELDQFYVAPVARGTGFAARFIAAIEAEFARRSIHQPWLIASVGNDRAARFYTKAGWQNVGIVDGVVEIPDGTFSLPCWRFEKTL